MAYGNASLEIIASAFVPMLTSADPLAQRVLRTACSISTSKSARRGPMPRR